MPQIPTLPPKLPRSGVTFHFALGTDKPVIRPKETVFGLEKIQFKTGQI